MKIVSALLFVFLALSFSSALCQIPTTFALYQNVPDPFDTSTSISFQTPRMTHIYVLVEDSVADSVETLVWANMNAGKYQLIWHPDSTISPGRYFCKMVADTFVDSIEMHYKVSLTSVVTLHPRGLRFSLGQNYPNPFNPSTLIRYQLAAPSSVTLKVYDALGREAATLVNERQTVGTHSVIFNAANIPSGVYFYRLQAGTFSMTKKLTVLK